MLCAFLLVGCNKSESEPTGLIEDPVEAKPAAAKPAPVELKFIYGLEREFLTKASWLRVTNISREPITVTHVVVNDKTHEKWYNQLGPETRDFRRGGGPRSGSYGSAGVAPARTVAQLPITLDVGRSFHFQFSSLGDRGVFAEVTTNAGTFKLE